MRSNFHRGMMAMVFAAALALGGARPAAAEGPVWREAWDWLGRMWNSVSILQPVHEATGECGPEIDPDGKPRCVPQAPPPCEDCGPEIDPNG